ncbi:hypothetical protein [Litoribacter populi]|uniref:hypothetical protein n=1 Tax=Litoribacter populi TaxID=2598460 RepID=UPI00163D8B25|nr:hypothetical protein [Litoribacter populi]
MSIIVGGIISLLLSLSAYLLHLMVLDIREMRVDQRELRELCIYLKAEQKIIRDYISCEHALLLSRKENMGAGP